MNNKKTIFLVLLLFFLLRLITACFLGKGVVSGEDSFAYNNYALTILKDFKWLYSADFIGSRRELIYPLFLAIIYFFFGKENFIAVYALQAAVNTLTVLIIYKLALRIFDKRVAVIALFWSGLYGFYLWFGSLIARETLVYFFLIFFFYLFYVYLTNYQGKNRVFTLALIYTFLIHTDIRYLYLLPAISLLFIIYKYFWQSIRSFFIFIFIVTIFSLPWTIRNIAVHNKFIFANLAIITVEGNALKLSDELRGLLRRVSEGKTLRLPDNPQCLSNQERELIIKGLNPKGRSAEEVWAIKKGACPADALWKIRWYNLRELWRPFMLHGIYDPRPTCRFIYWSFRHNLFSLIFYGTLLPFILIGISILLIRKKKVTWFFLIPLLFHTVFHTLIWGEYRFRTPIDSLLIILGAYGIDSVYKFLLIARKRSL